MKKIYALLAMMALVSPALAANPWAGDGDTVNINVVVPEITEVWSNIGTGQARSNAPAITLNVDNAGGIFAPASPIQDAVNANANVPVQVKVQLNGDIPEWTRLSVVIGATNRGLYNNVFAWANSTNPSRVSPAGATVITWDHRAGTTYVGNQLNTAINAFTAPATLGAGPATTKQVDYVADAIMGMPSVTAGVSTSLVYTIAATI